MDDAPSTAEIATAIEEAKEEAAEQAVETAIENAEAKTEIAAAIIESTVESLRQQEITHQIDGLRQEIGECRTNLSRVEEAHRQEMAALEQRCEARLNSLILEHSAPKIVKEEPKSEIVEPEEVKNPAAEVENPERKTKAKGHRWI